MKTVAVLALLWISVCQATPVEVDDVQLEDTLRPFDPPGPPFALPLFPEDGQWQSALWNSGKYQGDIVLNEEQERLLQLNSSERNAMKYEITTWIPVNRVIPFEFAPNTFTDEEKRIITEWLKEFERNSCLTVRPRTDEVDYVQIIDDPGFCWSRLGREGGMQPLSLGRPVHGGHCIFKSTVIHEFMHAAGFWHEQARQDRDKYVYVARQNVNSTQLHNFDKAPAQFSQDIGQYDYQSVMQYIATAFTKNGRKTMIRLDGSDKELGQPTNGTFTENDLYKLNTLYKCDYTGPITPAPSTQAPTTTPTTQQPTTESGSCADVANNKFCTSNSRFCNDYKDFMHKFCRKTCGYCEEPCKDVKGKGFWCGVMSSWCPYSQPGDFMDINCRKTCNKC